MLESEDGRVSSEVMSTIKLEWLRLDSLLAIQDTNSHPFDNLHCAKRVLEWPLLSTLLLHQVSSKEVFGDVSAEVFLNDLPAAWVELTVAFHIEDKVLQYD